MPEAPQEPNPEMFGPGIQNVLAHMEVHEGYLFKIAADRPGCPEEKLASILSGVLATFGKCQHEGSLDALDSLVHALGNWAKQQTMSDGRTVGEVLEEMLKAEQFRNN